MSVKVKFHAVATLVRCEVARCLSRNKYRIDRSGILVFVESRKRRVGKLLCGGVKDRFTQSSSRGQDFAHLSDPTRA